MMGYIIPSHTQTAILLGLDDLKIPKLPSIFEMNPSQAPFGRPQGWMEQRLLEIPKFDSRELEDADLPKESPPFWCSVSSILVPCHISFRGCSEGKYCWKRPSKFCHLRVKASHASSKPRGSRPNFLLTPDTTPSLVEQCWENRTTIHRDYLISNKLLYSPACCHQVLLSNVTGKWSTSKSSQVLRRKF